jgi:porin
MKHFAEPCRSLSGICRLLVLAMATAVWTPLAATAQPVAVPETWGGDFWSRPRLTGNWFGLRDELGKKGLP